MTEPLTIEVDRGDSSLFQSLNARSQPCLILYSGPDAGRRFDLDPGLQVVGRGADAQVLVDSPGISRRHAELQVGSNCVVVLRDLGSANRTHVNDQRAEGPVVLKDGDLLRLGNVVMRFHDQRSIDALLHDRIYRLATLDEGTGVFNRRHFHDTLKLEIRRARQAASDLSLICYDLDHFKAVNDAHGHAAGDLVLRESSTLVQAALQPGQVLARVGGEEFAVLLPQSDLATALALAERLRAAVAGHAFMLPGARGEPGVPHRQTISLGVARLGGAMSMGAELLEAADRQLYIAKNGGRNRVSG